MERKANPSALTRASLLIRLNHNGPEREVAWAEFYDLYAPIISGFARRMGVRAQDVDDLVQDVMNGFFRASPEFVYDPARGRLRGYLKRCVWHKLAELRQKRGYQALGSLLDDLSDPDSIAVESVWEDVWEAEKLGQALAIVRGRYSVNEERKRTFRAFEMVTLLERPVAQVAAELGMSADSVRTARSRVSESLREEFDRLEGL